MKHTAVEFLINHIMHSEFETDDEWREVFVKAKSMEKEQIEDAFEEGKNAMEEFHDEVPDEDECVYLMNGRDYYNETYGK